MRGHRVFVTGGTGFFGAWLLESFAYANAQLGLRANLVCLTRDANAFGRKAPYLVADPSIKVCEGDVRKFAFPAGEFSHVVHAATTSGVPVEPVEMLDTITLGTRRVLDFAVETGAGKFLLTSSGAVYGKQPPELSNIPETYVGAPCPNDPLAAYGEGKRVAELLCAIYNRNHGIETKIARCFAFVGPHLPIDGHFAVGNFIRDALAGGPIRVNGDGSPVRSYLYAADLAVWLWTILFRGNTNEPYNVGSGSALSIAETARQVGSLFNPAIDVSIAKSPDLGQLPQRYVPDVRRVFEDLHLEESIDLKHALQNTLNWHLNN